MRSYRGLLTGVAVCSTLLLVALNSKSAVEVAGDPKSGRVKVSAGKREMHGSQMYRSVTPSLAELGPRGALPKTNEHILMLTRIPDAGAELLVLILQRLQGYNAFKHIRLPAGDSGPLTTLQQELLVEEITNIIRQEAIPLSFDGDVRFLNFSKFGRQAPTFISLVRDPIGARNSKWSRRGRKNVLESRAIPTFCGQDPRCAGINDKWALERAKANVIEYYPFVGILDDMERSMEALERKFPYFFRGAKRIYKRIQPKGKEISDSMLSLSSRDRDIASKYLADEIEFYRWLKLRLSNETFVRR